MYFINSNELHSMKSIIVGTFSSRNAAESLIHHLTNESLVTGDDISYLYKNADGKIEQTDSTGDKAVDGATEGAVLGGSVGAIAGIATVVGLIPVIGPIFAAGPIIAALGIGAAGAAITTTAAGALTGALAGGVIGALVKLGAPEEEAREYEERLSAGDVLVTAYTENPMEVRKAFDMHGSSSVREYTTFKE